MRRSFLHHPFSIVRVFLLLLTGSTGVQGSELEIHGSNTVGARLAPMLMSAYLQQYTGGQVSEQETSHENEKLLVAEKQGATVTVKIAAHGSSTGYKALASGQADIWASSRPVKDSEAEAMGDRADLTALDNEHVIAIDGLAILVHPANPVSEMSMDTLARVFSGAITNWSAVGGENRKITLYARDDRSGTWDTFKSLVLGKAHPLATSAKRYESNDQLSDDVSRDPSAIGFAGLASVRNSKVLAISDGDAPALKPNQLTVASEDYPLARRLFMYTPGQTTTGMARNFIEFALGADGQALVSESGFISQNPIAVKPEFGSTVPETFRRLTRDYLRLTVNFRFAEGRSRLDNKAKRDLQRIADYLRRENRRPDELMLIGFADRQSNELRAQMISEYRALAVRKALNELKIRDVPYTGYGHEMQIGSSGGDAGQRRNGRVEVWIRKR